MAVKPREYTTENPVHSEGFGCIFLAFMVVLMLIGFCS